MSIANEALRNTIFSLCTITLTLNSCTEAFSQLQWPFPSSNQQATVTGSVGEYRFTAGSGLHRFHQGVDLTNGAERSIHSINAGTVIWNQVSTASGSIITVTSIDGRQFNYIHIMPRSEIVNGTMTQVAIGDYLGEMIVATDWPTHLHLEEETTNFLNNNLYPYIDNSGPRFSIDHIPNAISFYRNGLLKTTSDPSDFQLDQEVAINNIDHTIVYGKIDIVAHAIDERVNNNGSAGGGQIVPTEISWRVRNADNILVTNDRLRFDGIPNNAAAVSSFHPLSAHPGSPSIHIITSHPRNTPYDRFWNSRLRSGQVESWDISVNRSANLDARLNTEATYEDGKYSIEFNSSDVDYNGNPNLLAQQRSANIVVDNFRPYIKEVLIKKFGPYGDLVYHGKWEWSGSALEDDFLKTNDAGPQDHIWVKIITSEPVESLSVNLEAKDGSSYFEIPAVNNINTEFVTTYTPIPTSGGQTLRIQANDLAGNPLQSNPAQIPIRQANGTWSAVSTTGIDANHQFNTGTFVCSDGSSGGRKSGARTSSGCLYADFSVDNSSVQTSEAVTFTPVVSGSGTITYNWNFGSGAMPATSTGSGPQAAIYTTGGAKTVTLQICDNTTNCITEEKVGVVTVNAQPGSSTLTVDFSVDHYGANVGEPFQFTSTVTGASGAVTYNWDFGEGLATGILTSANPTVTYATPGNKTISLTVTDANGSVSKVRTSWLYIYPTSHTISPVISSGCGPTDATGRVNLSAFGTTGGNGPPYDSYSWDFGDGSYETTSIPSIPHTYSKKGTYTVRVTVCDETGCATGESMDCVIVPTSVESGTLDPDFLIDGKRVSLSNLVFVGLNRPTKFTSVTTGGGNPSDFTYKWRFDCDYNELNCKYSITTEGPKVQEYVFKSVGPKSVTLTVDNGAYVRVDPYSGYVLEVVTGMGADGCYADMGNVTVSNTCWTSSNPPQFNVPIAKANCPIAKITVMDLTPPGGVILPNNVLDFSTHDQIPQFPYTSNFGIAVYQYDGLNYTVIASKIQQFTIYGPVPADAGPDQQTCLGSTAILGVSTTDGVGYIWSTINGSPLAYLSSTSSATPTFNAVQKGTFKYRVTATNLQTGCTATDDVTIVVDKPEVATSTFWAKLATPLPLSVSSTSGFGNNTYNWSPSNYLSSSSASNPSFTTSEEGDYNYLVTATDQRGCQGSGQIYVNASSAPGNLVAKAEAYSRISLTWVDRSDNETGFVIQRSVGSTSGFVNYGTVGANVSLFQDLNVDKNNTYYYRVSASIAGSNSSFTNIALVSTSSLAEFSISSLPQDFLSSAYSRVISHCDIDKDGSAEIISKDNSVVRIHKISNGSNTILNSISVSPRTIIDVYPYDLDGDDDYDILITTDQGISLYRNDNLSFVLLQNPFLNFDGEIGFIDYDNDNDLDLTIGNVLYKNNGNLTFSSAFNTFDPAYSGFSYGELSIGSDMDNDGDQDLLFAEKDQTGSSTNLRLYTNENNGFSAYSIVTASWTQGSLDVADYNNDNKNDIITSLYTFLFTNQGENIFSGQSMANTNLDRQMSRWGDFDLDGQLDFFTSCTRQSSNAVRKNDLGAFSTINLTGGPEMLDWLDFDNDGDLDILAVRHLFKNNLSDNLSRLNNRPAPPSNPCIYFNKSKATFSWDPATDTETPSPGLTYNLYVKQNGQFVMSPLANIDNGFRKVVGRGNVSQNTSWTITLPGTGNIEWGVQAIDNQYVGSVFAKNLLSPVQTACGNITTSITVGGRDILAPNVCSPNETIVSNGATLTLEAANLIRLLPGFRVLPGSFLHGRLTNYTSTDNPCVFESPEGKISEEGSVEETVATYDQISVYPNPNKGNFTIEASFEQEANTVEVSVISLSGTTIFSRRYNSVEYLMQEIDIVQFPQGVYLIRVIKDNKTVYRKVVKI